MTTITSICIRHWPLLYCTNDMLPLRPESIISNIDTMLEWSMKKGKATPVILAILSRSNRDIKYSLGLSVKKKKKVQFWLSVLQCTKRSLVPWGRGNIGDTWSLWDIGVRHIPRLWGLEPMLKLWRQSMFLTWMFFTLSPLINK